MQMVSRWHPRSHLIKTQLSFSLLSFVLSLTHTLARYSRPWLSIPYSAYMCAHSSLHELIFSPNSTPTLRLEPYQCLATYERAGRYQYFYVLKSRTRLRYYNEYSFLELHTELNLKQYFLPPWISNQKADAIQTRKSSMIEKSSSYRFILLIE